MDKYESKLTLYRRQSGTPADCIVRLAQRVEDGAVVVTKHLRGGEGAREVAMLGLVRGCRHILELLEHFSLADAHGVEEVLVFSKHDSDLARGAVHQRALVVCLLEALADMHARGVIHGDIKPANVLFSAARGEAVVIDLGSARTEAEAESGVDAEGRGLAPCVGTRGYASPQLRARERVSFADDVYSAGVIAAELAFPFDLNMAQKPNTDVCSAIGPLIEKWKQGVSPERAGPLCQDEAIMDLLPKLLHPDRSQRITAQAALERIQ
jgi:serine/threonine protein kinase